MNQQLYIDAMHAKGVADAQDLQTRSASMDGTALYACLLYTSDAADEL